MDERSDYRSVEECEGSLYLLARYRHRDAIESLLKRGVPPDQVKGKDYPYPTALDAALENFGTGPDYDLARLLISMGADVNYLYDKLSFLGRQLRYRRKAEVIFFLLDNGADIDYVIDGVTILMMAVENRSVEVIRRLIDMGASILAQDEQGKTIYDYALKSNSCEVINFVMQEMISAGAKPKAYTEQLRHALGMSHTQTVLHLIRDSSLAPYVDVNFDYGGKTLLMYAASNKDIVLAAFLLKAGADVNRVEARTAMTALHYACAAADPELIKLLLGNRALPHVGSSTKLRAYAAGNTIVAQAIGDQFDSLQSKHYQDWSWQVGGKGPDYFLALRGHSLTKDELDNLCESLGVSLVLNKDSYYAYCQIFFNDEYICFERSYGCPDSKDNERKILMALAEMPAFTIKDWEVSCGGDGYPGVSVAQGQGWQSFLRYIGLMA